MRIRKKSPEVSIFIKLLLVFLLIVLPLYILNMAANLDATKEIRNQITSSIINDMNSRISRFEAEIHRISNMQSIYAVDSTFLDLALNGDKLSSYERHVRNEYVLEKINLLSNMSPDISNVSIYFPLVDTKIDTFTNGVIKGSYADEIENITNNTLLYQKGEEDSKSAEYKFTKESLYYSTSSIQKIKIDKYIPALTIRVDISADNIKRDLLGLVEHLDGTALLLNSTWDWHISNTGENIDPQKVINSYMENLFSDTNENIFSFEIKSDRYILAYKDSYYLDSTLVVCVPENRILEPMARYRGWIWIISLYAIAIVIIFTAWIYGFVEKPIVKMIEAFNTVEEGNLDVVIMHQGNDEFRRLYMHFNRMVRKINELISSVYEQRIRLQNSQLKQLQYQINPHFLYNSFMIVTNMIQLKDYDTAAQVTQLLSSYYQQVTWNSDDDDISLMEEMKLADNYLQIQSVRFYGRIEYEIGVVPDRYRKLKLPRFILQPILENCYNHGLKNKKKDGRISIYFNHSKDYLYICIEDNGEEFDNNTMIEMNNRLNLKDTEITNSGLLNVHRRLQLKFGRQSGLKFLIGELGGALVEVRIYTGGDIHD